ncbi:uncharacterized protein RJT20DRAFT_125085 [Scheffersomyces xylosifermentans]|uniref:uncharacterized protein n=1 Tax=Scheffersomyces xylosifermentans TaxID=1304137 RepID=UPI00315CACB0
MEQRQPSDSSSNPSSSGGGMNIRRFIRDTEISDQVLHGSISTVQTSTFEGEKSGTKNEISHIAVGTHFDEASPNNSFQFTQIEADNSIIGSDMPIADSSNVEHSPVQPNDRFQSQRLNPIQEEAMEKKAEAQSDQNELNSMLSKESPSKYIKPSKYQEKLSYIPNSRFEMDQDSSSLNLADNKPVALSKVQATKTEKANIGLVQDRVKDFNNLTNSNKVIFKNLNRSGPVNEVNEVIYDSPNVPDTANTLDSPLHSIPNTFKYKSHPNAKTKQTIGATSLRHTINPEGKDSSNPEHENANKSNDTPPIKTSTLRSNLNGGNTKSNSNLNSYNHSSNIFNTYNANHLSNAVHTNETPEWMPSELQDKWSLEEPRNDFSSSVRITKKGSLQSQQLNDLDLNLEFASGNTILHNSKFNSLETPMWRKVAEEYEQEKKSHPNLQNIFLSLESSHNDKSEHANNTNPNNHSVSSTFSTPMATISHQQLKAINKDHEENGKLLEQLNQQDFKYPRNNPESPLKLFANNYDTYTKEKLTGVLKKIHQHTPPLPQAQDGLDELEPTEEMKYIGEPDEEPRLKIKNFTKSKHYTDEQFKQNANNIFKNIKKRGFRPSQDDVFRSISNAHTTATSTPKSHKIVDKQEEQVFQDDQSSFTSDFNDESSDYKYQQFNSDAGNNDFTSFDHSSKNNDGTSIPQVSSSNLHNASDMENDSLYTFEDFSEDNEPSPAFDKRPEPRVMQKPTKIYSPQAHSFVTDDISRKLANMTLDENKSQQLREVVEKLQLENERLKSKLNSEKVTKDVSEISIDNMDLTNEDLSQIQDFIKWKRASQLQLPQSEPQPSDIVKERNTNSGGIIRGRIKPGVNLPVAYDNMILDVKNQKWVASENKENYQGSLDSIEDLVTNSEEHENESRNTKAEADHSIIKSSNQSSRKRNNSKLEVSFHLPHQDSDFERDESPQNNEVTRISQIDEITFSQTHKKLVSIINEILSADETVDLPWEDINEIPLSNYQLESVKDLKKFLPNLINVDLSQNNLKYLEGLPKSILKLDLTGNQIENITPFSQFHDLQYLNVSSNRLVNLSNLSKNIHLTDLNVSKNVIKSFGGLQSLLNLTKLDASQNKLTGALNFENYYLPNLQDLNLSENSISSISGIESLGNLRILNLNENKITIIKCKNKHFHLKKLLLKFNNLKQLDLEFYPFLRVLRIDGNLLDSVAGLHKLANLDELSCKSQHSGSVIDDVYRSARDVKHLDLSGNLNCNLLNQVNPFFNVNQLELSALGLINIPDSFATIFPNVRELNLNFNKLESIEGLSRLGNLRKVYLVSNKIQKTETIVKGLLGSRNTLRVLDLRLNLCNIDLYPYVFSPDELEFTKVQNFDDKSPIHLDTLDDIESFAIHYKSLSKGVDEWTERDSMFVNKLSAESAVKVHRRLNYETLLINFFRHLSRLDGGHITNEKRNVLRERLNSDELSEIV